MQDSHTESTGKVGTLQTRARTLDGTIRQKFEEWYPILKSPNKSFTAEQCTA